MPLSLSLSRSWEARARQGRRVRARSQVVVNTLLLLKLLMLMLLLLLERVLLLVVMRMLRLRLRRVGRNEVERARRGHDLVRGVCRLLLLCWLRIVVVERASISRGLHLPMSDRRHRLHLVSDLRMLYARTVPKALRIRGGGGSA